MVRLDRILKTITYAFAAVAWTSVAGELKFYYSLAFAAMYSLAVYFDWRPTPRIPGWLLTVASICIPLHSAFRINPEYFIEPILDTLVILMAIKLLAEKKYRDYMQIYMLGIFVLLGSGLVSFSISFLPYLFVMLAFSTVALMVLAFLSQNPDMCIGAGETKGLFQQAALICCIAIPASALFFFILPRSSFPLFNFFGKGWPGISGFSDRVDLGDLTQIQEDASTIFRAQMDRIDEADLYWRGIVLDSFDGRSWKSDRQWSPNQPVHLKGHEIHQTVYLEPYGHRYLFALDKPISTSLRNVDKSNGLTFALKTHLFTPLQYTADSVPTAFLPDSSTDLIKYLQLPDGYGPRIRELVRQLAGTGSEGETLGILFRFISRGDYKYTLKNLHLSDTPLEDFLFEHKEGNCEYFASALGVMLRMADIPSRLVGGYKGGYYNAAGSYYLVLQKHAHVWVEAYTEEQGWMRLDPTPYTPENPGAAYANSFLIQLRLMMDTFNYYWNKSVISYDFSRQLAIVNAIRSTMARSNFKLNFQKTHLRRYAPVVFALLGVALLAAAIRIRLRPRHERILSAFLRRMAGRGYRKTSFQGLEEFLHEVREEDLKSRAALFVADYQNIYYRDGDFTAQDTTRLRGRIREI